MNALDILLAVIGFALVICGFARGLARTVLDILGLLAAFLVASRFAGRAAAWFAFTGWSDEARTLLGYVTLFGLVVLAAELAGWLVRKFLKAAKLGFVDRLAGGAVGLVAAVLAAALLILPVVAYSSAGESLLDRSSLAPYVVAVADLAATVVPDDLEQRYRSGVERLRKHWRGEWGREVVRTSPGGDPNGA